MFPGLPYTDSDMKQLGDDYYNDDEYYSDTDYEGNADEQVVHTVPEFTSQTTDQMVNEGDTIKMPCFVDKLGKI